MDVYREFFMWAILHEYEEAVKSNTDEADFFLRVHEILERLEVERAQAVTKHERMEHYVF